MSLEEQVAIAYEKAKGKTDKKFGGIIEVIGCKGSDPEQEPTNAMYKALFLTRVDDTVRAARTMVHAARQNGSKSAQCP